MMTDFLRQQADTSSARTHLILREASDSPILIFQRSSKTVAEDLGSMLRELVAGNRPGRQFVPDETDITWKVDFRQGDTNLCIVEEVHSIELALSESQWSRALELYEAYSFLPNQYIWIDESTDLSLLLTADGKW